MMKTLIQRFLPAALLLLATTACEDTLTAPEAPATGDGPTLTLVLDNEDEGAQTRTELESADAKHHVTKVRILIFEGEGGTAKYVGEEEFTWDDTDNNNKMEYALPYAFADGVTYTLLGVGMDDAFESTYTIEENQTLDETYARLQQGKGGEDLKQCEFFTGTLEYTHTDGKATIGTLLVKRRVAGVMLYVKEIPQRLPAPAGSGSSYEWRTTKVLLRLGRAPKKDIVLRRDFSENTTWTEPEGNLTDDYLTEDDQILLEMDLTGLKYDTQKDIYETSETNNTLYQACYMLPLNKLTENYNTFTVEIWGVEDEDGTGNTWNDANHDGVQDDEESPKEVKLLKSLIVENKDESTTSFNIRSNYIYCIGKKATGVDQPISLSGEAVYVEVQPWEGEINTNNPDFGAARVQALFDQTNNEIQNCMNHWHTVKLLPPVKMMWPYVTKITVKVNSVNQIDDPWLSIRNAVPNENETVQEKLDDTYTTANEYVIYQRDKEGSEAFKEGKLHPIEIFMEDYAEPRTYGWNNGNLTLTEKDIENILNDVRRCDLVLYTTFNYNQQEFTREDYITIQQYNTITVDYKVTDEDNKVYNIYCGFNREDLGGDDAGFKWGYDDVLNGDTYQDYNYHEEYIGYKGSPYNGTLNIKYINILPLHKNDWNESAVNKAQHICYQINTSNDKLYALTSKRMGISNEGDVNVGWYLPAEYELKGLMDLSVESTKWNDVVESEVTTVPGLKQNSVIKLKEYQSYWSSTTAGSVLEDDPDDDNGKPQNSAVAFKYNIYSGEYKAERKIFLKSDEGARIRQAIRFDYAEAGN